MRLLAGTYTIKNLVIYKKENLDKPFFEAERIEISVGWRLLFKGKYSLKVDVQNSTVLFVTSSNKGKNQIAIDEKKANWVQALKTLVPLSIESLEASNLLIKYENMNLKGLEKNNILVKKLKAEYLLDPQVTDTKTSPFSFEGLINDHAKFSGYGGLDLTQTPGFVNIDSKIIAFDMTSANKLLKHFVPVDLTSGTMDVYAEFKGSTKKADGYFKVFFEDLDILKVDQKYKSPNHFLIEFTGSLVNWLLSTLSEKNIATEIPFRFRDQKFEVDTTKAFWNTLENSWDSLKKEYNNI